MTVVKERTRYYREVGTRFVSLLVVTIFNHTSEHTDWKPVRMCHCLKRGKYIYVDASVIEKFYTEE